MGYVFADAVVGHAPFHWNAHVGHVGKLQSVVGFSENGFGNVLAYLVLIDIESSHHFDVFDPVVAYLDMHDARDFGILG